MRLVSLGGRLAFLGLVGSLLGALTLGCATTRTSSSAIANEESIDRGSASNAGAWLFWPTTVRVHPLSRANPNAVPPSLDVRLEFSDADGSRTRAVGTVVIAIQCSSAVPQETRFTVPLRTRAENAALFDDVTDTYRITLTPEWTKPPASGSAVRIDVFYFGLDGAAPTATGSVTW
ncbi:MAG: hypothetical protein JNM94_17450 [Phycisphaerae bacterium]|nr:hypothetical protein [Phycisphaerae bacterium]